MKKKITPCLAFASILFLLSACNSSDTRYVWDGAVVESKYQDFQRKIKDQDALKELEFRNSPGAPAKAGILTDAIETQIDKKGIHTFARGQCASACANIFLLSPQRTLLPSLNKVRTHLMIHVSRASDNGEIDYGGSEKMNKRIVSKSAGKIPLELLDKIFDAKNKQGGIYIFREPIVTDQGEAYVLFCAGDEVPFLRTCKPMKGIKPQDLGISIGV
ncbi:hypothetical protein ACO0K9_24855 [Undibacterium sp. Ji50W]|uniref:hypothetical protein n=1 Tax=Undibacterium sp. Ji50W TaxID=3413041 RepID=UPI003BF1079C